MPTCNIATAIASIPFISAFMMPSSTEAQLPRAFPSDSAVRAVLEQRVAAGIAPGYAVGFVDASGSTRIVTVGSAAGNRPVDARTVFEIGSITKTFTGTALASLAADGSVTLDQPLDALLPAGTRVPARGDRRITLADLATQRSGLPRLPANLAPTNLANPYAAYDGKALLSFLASYELPRDPGAQYEYSNLGMGLLGYALATRTNGSYESLIRSRVLQPLGMTETGIALTPALRARMADGHDAGGRVVPAWDWDALAGAGALRSTITDMLRYLDANLAADLDARDPRTHGIGSTLAAAHRVTSDKAPSGMAMGLAWHRLSRAPGDTIIWHNGATFGFTGFLGYSPQRRLGVVVLTNSATAPDDIALHWLAGAPLRVVLPAATLDRYVGRYELTPDFSLVVSREGAQLRVAGTGQDPLPMVPESLTRFAVRAVNAVLEFELDAAGMPVAVTLVQGGARQRGVRR